MAAARVDGQGATVASNDNWKSDQQTRIENSGLAPSDDKEAALVTPLPPGVYVIAVSDANGKPGISFAQAYLLPFNGDALDLRPGPKPGRTRFETESLTVNTVSGG